MVKSGKNKINSVLVAYLPELRGFFYSSFWEFCFNQIFIFIKRKVIKQIAHLKTDFGVSGLIILPYTLRELKKYVSI